MSSKYNVSSNLEKRTYDGVVYDSAMEMKFMRDYVAPKIEAGEIESVERQIKYQLQPSFKHDGKNIRAIDYVADFVLHYPDGHITIIDIKGMPDSVAKIKRKLFFYRYPELDYQWISYVKKFGGWIEYDELVSKRRQEKRIRKEQENGNK